MAMTRPQRNLAAELRAVEEGHVARLALERGVLLVCSDTRPGVVYELRPESHNGLLYVTCTCPSGSCADRGAPGDLACKHAALVARRLERTGLARFDGACWVVTERALDLAEARP